MLCNGEGSFRWGIMLVRMSYSTLVTIITSLGCKGSNMSKSVLSAT